MSWSLVDLRLRSLNVSREASRSSKKTVLVLVRRPGRALTRSSLPFKIQKPSKTAGMRGTRAALLNRLIATCRSSKGTRVKGQVSEFPVLPLMPYQQSIKNLRPVLVETNGQALAPSGSWREVGLKE